MGRNNDTMTSSVVGSTNNSNPVSLVPNRSCKNCGILRLVPKNMKMVGAPCPTDDPRWKGGRTVAYTWCDRHRWDSATYMKIKHDLYVQLKFQFYLDLLQDVEADIYQQEAYP